MENLDNRQFNAILDGYFYDILNQSYNSHPEEIFEAVNPRLLDVILRDLIKHYNNEYLSSMQFKIFLSSLQMDISEPKIICEEEYSYKLYKKYSEYFAHLKTKLINFLQLLTSVRGAGGPGMEKTRGYLKEKYDIKVDENGYIDRIDSIRLLKAIYESIDELMIIANKINDYSTYAAANEESDRILDKQIFDSLQIYDLTVQDTRGYLELTYDQRKELGEENTDDGLEEAFKTYEDLKTRCRKKNEE